ncbi:MAG: hypothetical protein HY901_16405 [Deltaproteobacteria bacterium]|nr:hypothetical protein [Deltaproteobacteria bacterium]
MAEVITPTIAKAFCWVSMAAQKTSSLPMNPAVGGGMSASYVGRSINQPFQGDPSRYFFDFLERRAARRRAVDT